jgi:ferrous iron transport protein B
MKEESMSLKIALAGNPNSGKTTLFNELTGSTQYVGNWPGVTVEKKEGRLRRHKGDVVIVDLPGIYSLSPYTLEEVIARDFILQEKPDVIINIVDASNLERNLYLTTQIIELGVPTVVALNMIDIVQKRGDEINNAALEKSLGCPVVSISAARNIGLNVLVDKATSLSGRSPAPLSFSQEVEKALGQIGEAAASEPSLGGYNPRWLAVKLFERDEDLLKKVSLPEPLMARIEEVITAAEAAMDDDAESIITNERYEAVSTLLSGAYIKKSRPRLSASDKIDRVLTNRFLALPIFFLIMWGVYFVSVQTVGDWTIGWMEGLIGWISGGVEGLLAGWGASPWVLSLVLDGIIGGVGGVLVFVPQLMILYLFISILEDVGYMARVAFIMDRIFRRFGLSGKSFIPMLIGTGCSVPAIMASRTIENENDRRMTVMLTPFIPCGAKLPLFALFVAMVFREASWVGPSMYLAGIIMVIVSGLILKRTKLFSGKPAPFVMELPAYKLPRLKGVLIHMWEKGKSFIIKAGTVIFVACAVLWFLQSFSFSFQYLEPEQIDQSILAGIGKVVAPIFTPLGFGNWMSAMAAMTGMVAKEVVVSTFAMLGAHTTLVFTPVTAYAFMIFTLLAAPCFAAIGAIRREMGSWKWTLIAIGYQTGLAYLMATLVNLIGSAIFPNLTPVQIVGEVEAAGEGAISSVALLENPMVYILGIILLAVIVIGLVSLVKRGGGKKNRPLDDTTCGY